jgi:two-component system heavy metal sensor histidine kinase CusS
MSSNGDSVAAAAAAPRRGPRSIATRLVALFTLSSTVLLGGVVTVFYRSVARHLDDEHMHLLAEVVHLLRLTPPDPNGGWPPLVRDERAATRPGKVNQEKYSIRIVSPTGASVRESPGMRRVPRAVFAGVPVTAPAETAAGVPWHAEDGTHFLIAAAPLPVRGGEAAGSILHVALDVTPDDELLFELRRTGALLVIVGVVASGLAGAFVARRSLSPIERMADVVSRVSARELDCSLDRRDFPRELRRLAIAFDDMLERLEAAFADISAYSGNLAHELRTPLGNLRGEIEVALLRARSVDEYRDVLCSSLEELKRMSRMVDALLFLARADRREATVTRKAVSVADEARSVAEFYAALAEDMGVRLECVGDATAELDSDLFRRALSNLVANSLRHVRPGGHVVIEARQAGDDIAEVSVIDDGCGIADSDLGHVFERFYRGTGSTDGVGPGSGLGLAIVRSIVELHGGKVALKSAVGAGTEVVLRFPSRALD